MTISPNLKGPKLPEKGPHYLQKRAEEAIISGQIQENDPRLHAIFKAHFQNNNALQKFVNDPDIKIAPLIPKLKSLGVPNDKISTFCHEVLSLCKKKRLPEKPNQPEPVVIQFFSDIEYRDWNGCIRDDLSSTIREQGCFIASRSLFLQSLQERELLKIAENYGEIYASENYLIFVPKKLGKTEEERLKKLDLNMSQVKKISLEEALKIKGKKPTIEAFTKLFNFDSEHKKLVYISGHGGPGSPAGMTAKQYRLFLDWAEQQHVEGLMVASCSSGGESSKLHLTALSGPQSQRNVSFPVVILSVGDLVSSLSSSTNKSETLMLQLHKVWNTPGKNTASNTRKTLESFHLNFDLRAAPKMYFPATPQSPAGFVTKERSDVFSLTFSAYKKLQLKNKPILLHRPVNAIYPIKIEVPVAISARLDKKLLSQIPGTAHQCFERMVLLDGDIEIFVSNQLKSFEYTMGKAFFIKSLAYRMWEYDKNSDYTHVFIDLQTEMAGWQHQGKFYLYTAKGKIQVPEWEYLLRLQEIMNKSLPDKNSVRVATGGQQSEREAIEVFEEMAKTSTFFRLLQTDTLTLDQLQELIELDKLDNKDKFNLVALMLSRNETLAIELFLTFKLSPDDTMYGEALLLQGARANALKFCKFLLDQGANPNVRDQTSMQTPLTEAIKYKNYDLFRLLLENPQFNLENRNNKGRPYYFSAIPDLEMFEALIKKYPNVDLNILYDPKRDGIMSTLLNRWTEPGSVKVMEKLILSGADVNKVDSNYSPLSTASHFLTSVELDLLLKYGANPYLLDGTNHCPLVEAMLHGSLETVKKLLSVEMPPLDAAQKEKVFSIIYIAAIKSGDAEKIKLCQDRSFRIPQSTTDIQNDRIKHGILLLNAVGRADIAKAIIDTIPKENVALIDYLNKKETDPEEERLRVRD